MRRLPLALVLLLLAGAARAAPGVAAPMPPWVLSDTLAPPPGLQIQPPVPPPLRSRVIGAGAAHGPAGRPRAALAGPVDTTHAGTSGVRLQVRGRGEMGGAWTRMRPCAEVSVSSCAPGALPQMAPDLDLVVRAEGRLLERWHILADYDGARELRSANRFQLRYQGEETGFLRRVEIGDVGLDLPVFRALGSPLAGERFGAAATASTGSLDLQLAFAERRGSRGGREFTLDGSAVAERLEGTLEDAEYVRGQFFFLVDPRRIPGYPHLDVLALRGDEVPEAERVTAPLLYRYSGREARDGSTPILTATAGSGEDAIALTGPFLPLEPETDYDIHPSGLWLRLRSPLHPGEALALDHPGAGAPVLLRAVGEDHRPGGPTWEREMRQVYRIAGPGEVDLGTVEVEVRDGAGAGDAALTVPHPAGTGYLTLLQLAGLDRAAPEGRVDPERLYRPGDGRTTPLYLVLPTLRPFADPAANPAAGLDEAAASAALGARAVPAIYDAAEASARLAGGRFRISYALRVTGGEALPRTFSLGALGVREGSETVSLDGRILQRGVDYRIRYETGQVELLGTAGLAAGADSRLRVAFEQDPAFGTPPARTVGLGGRLRLGDLGEMRFLGISEREAALEPRPTLGAEGGAVLLGAVGGDLRIPLPGLDRLLGMASRGPASSLAVSGELAVSLPDPTREAVAFLDDFDRASVRPVSLIASGWRLGSAPASTAGAGPHSPAAFDAATATGLIWQHAYLDEAGRVRGALGARELDRELRALAGSQEEALHLTFAGGRAGPGWRSVTTVLSPAGTDLRDYGYLEFYLRADAPAHALVLDLGTVSEDAMAIDSLGATSGVHADGRPWGEGVLDSQWDPATEVWTEAHDARELWPTGCRATPGEVYPLGDPAANCTRGTGRPQSEDLDGNGRLDTDERALRFTLDLADRDHPWIARGPAETGTRFHLVRIPLGEAAGGDAASGELRRARHLRITVVGDAPARLALARMRFVGAGWSHRERASTGRGLVGGDTVSASVQMEAGPVDARTSGDFAPPPGLERVAGQALESDVPELAALSLRFRGLGADERAEVQRSFPGRPPSFLGYRRLRLWASAREGQWGEGGAELVVRVGPATDGHYLYRTPLRAGAVSTAAEWEAVAVEIERWLALRARAEDQLRRTHGDPGDLQLWSTDGTHALVLPAGGRMPNLAAVREVWIGVWNGGDAATDGEVWIDHLRLEGGAVDPGLAGHLSVALDLGPHLGVRLDHRGSGASFRSAPGVPAFQGEDASSAELRADLGGWLPEGWGVRAPVRLGVERWAEDPRFLRGSDLLPDRVAGLDPGGGRTVRGSVQLSRATASASPAGRILLDPWTLDLRMRSARDRQTAHRREAAETDLTLAYDLHPAGAAPAHAGPRWLPTRFGVRLRYLDVADRRLRTDGDQVLTAGGRVERRAGGDVSAAIRPLQGVDGQLALGAGRYLARDGSPGGGGDRTVRNGLTLRPPLPEGIDLTADLRGRFALRDLPPAGVAGPVVQRGGFENGNEIGGRLALDPHALALRLAGEGPLAAAARRIAVVEAERRVTLDSRFDRSEARPGWRYALALGGREAFGAVQGDSAALLAAADRQTIRTRIRLGRGLDLDLSHERTDRDHRSRWSPRVERETEWPAARLSWEVPQVWGVENLTLATGYAARRLERTELATGQRREEREMRVPVQVAVSPGGWRLSYRADWRVQDRLWLGNRTARTVIDHMADARFRFAPPSSLAALTEPIELAIDYRAGDRRDCRLEPGWTGCTTGSLFHAQRSHTLGVRGSAGVRGGRLGLHLDLDDRADRIGAGSGRARVTLGLFGQFTVDARAGAPAPAGPGW